MTSQINPSNIDGTYPVAGQDNNSQGFRTNFTNTVTNFQYAKNEITDLQNKAIFKTALTGTTLDNDMQGSPLSNALLSDMAEVVVPLGTVSGTFTVDYVAGPVQTVTLGANSTLAFTNWPVSGNSGTVTVKVTVTTNPPYTLTLPATVSVNNVGIQGLNTSTNVLTFPASGTYSLTFSTFDAGATITVNQTNQALTPFNASVQSIASGNVSAATTTIFTSSADVTANLAAGTSGQIKILAYGNTSVGNTLVTVANAAWGGSNIANLNAVGSACTLQYVNSQWYCIGNNGVTFS